MNNHMVALLCWNMLSIQAEESAVVKLLTLHVMSRNSKSHACQLDDFVSPSLSQTGGFFSLFGAERWWNCWALRRIDHSDLQTCHHKHWWCLQPRHRYLNSVVLSKSMWVWLPDVAVNDFPLKLTDTNVQRVFSLHPWRGHTTSSGISVDVDTNTILQVLRWSRTQSTFLSHMSICHLILHRPLMAPRCFWTLEMLYVCVCFLITGCSTTSIATPPLVVICFSPCEVQTAPSPLWYTFRLLLSWRILYLTDLQLQDDLESLWLKLCIHYDVQQYTLDLYLSLSLCLNNDRKYSKTSILLKFLSVCFYDFIVVRIKE